MLLFWVFGLVRIQISGVWISEGQLYNVCLLQLALMLYMYIPALCQVPIIHVYTTCRGQIAYPYAIRPL